MKFTLVSIVSDQTIPNLELIKEFKGQVGKYVFLCSEQKTSQLTWLTQAAIIKEFDTINVDPYDPDQIEGAIKKYDFGEGDVVLNITGGTKILSLILNEHFRSIGATIYYLTGRDKSYIKVFPNRGRRNLKLSCQVTLPEYLISHGFTFKKREPFRTYQEAVKLLHFFSQEDNRNYMDVINKLRSRRGKTAEVKAIEGLQALLEKLSYLPEKKEKLSKNDVKYLTSDWLEEYVYYKVMNDLSLSSDFVGTGYTITKDNVPNELDVLFVYHNKLFIAECKTSFYETVHYEKESGGKKEIKSKEINLLPGFIYKSDALRSKFGLFANTSLFTLASVRDEEGAVKSKLKSHFERAELSKIRIISQKGILSGKPVQKLLNI